MLEVVRFNCHQKVWAQVDMDKCPAEPPPLLSSLCPCTSPLCPLAPLKAHPLTLPAACFSWLGKQKEGSASECVL